MTTALEIKGKIPRLKAGQGYGGPEYYGCSGTGQRPIIRRVDVQRGDGSRDTRYIVGPEYNADTLCETRAGRIAVIEARNVGKGRERVWVYCTRSSALGRFAGLCLAIYAWNDGQRAERNKAATDARSADPSTAMAGALALGDF